MPPFRRTSHRRPRTRTANDRGHEIRLALQDREQFGRVGRSVFPDQQRQLGEGFGFDQRNHGAGTIDDREFSRVLPKRKGFAFPELDVDDLRQGSFDDRVTNPGEQFKPLFGGARIESEFRLPPYQAERAKDGAALGPSAAFDQNFGDLEADPRQGRMKSRSGLRRLALDPAAAPQPARPAHGGNDETDRRDPATQAPIGRRPQPPTLRLPPARAPFA